jgi:hypothetical protein
MENYPNFQENAAIPCCSHESKNVDAFEYSPILATRMHLKVKDYFSFAFYNLGKLTK